MPKARWRPTSHRAYRMKATFARSSSCNPMRRSTRRRRYHHGAQYRHGCAHRCRRHPSPSKELFHLAAIDTLRVLCRRSRALFQRPRSRVPTASLTLDEFPGESFRGRLVRNSNAIDLASRTLLVEVDVDNPAGRLLPGAYTSVHLSLPSAVSIRHGPRQYAALPQRGLAYRGRAQTATRNWFRSPSVATYGEKVENPLGFAAG